MAGYEGWKNYETWSTNLTLSNDEKSYRYWRKAALDALDAYNSHAALISLAKRMENELTKFLDSRSFKELPEFAQNLLIMDIREVDWKEVALAWIDQG